MPDPEHDTGTRLTGVTPLLPVRDLAASVAYYTDGLGFTFVFGDRSGAPGYAGLERDGLTVHLQWQSASEFEQHRAGPAMLRIRVDDIDTLFEELRTRGRAPLKKAPKKTPWGTREFWLTDPDGHNLLFYSERDS